MAVQAHFGFGGVLPPYAGGWPEEQLPALRPPATGDKLAHRYDCVASNGGALGAVVAASRKRGRDAALEHHLYVPLPSSSPALLPIPIPWAGSNASRMAESAAASTSGRTAGAIATAADDALAAELLWQQQQGAAEVDALVRAWCERLRAGLERARKRRCEVLARAAARALRGKEAELEAARRRAAELEERLRQAAAEAAEWCGLARSNEAVASGLRATLHAVLLHRAAAGAGPAPEEGFGDSGGADDAQSCWYVAAAADTDTAASPAGDGKWACKACGSAEASVLLLPCRHLCLCKACEPRTDACPVCSGAKNASIHVEPN